MAAPCSVLSCYYRDVNFTTSVIVAVCAACWQCLKFLSLIVSFGFRLRVHTDCETTDLDDFLWRAGMNNIKVICTSFVQLCTHFVVHMLMHSSLCMLLAPLLLAASSAFTIGRQTL